MRAIRILFCALTLAALAARPAAASFHLMQIEQVIGGVNGHTDIQAVQLRMRALGQNLVSGARLLVRDATGSNPILLIDFTTNVANGSAGDRVLAATSNFSATTTPALTPDFILANPIPSSYLAAGSLTYEDDFGTILWRLSWGGSSYTGSGLGSLTNDVDGNFNPPFSGPLPSTTTQALLFQNGATALSTNNLADYALTTGAATFTNNARSSGTINDIVGVGDDVASGSLMLSPPTPNPVKDAMAIRFVLPHTARAQVRLLDTGGRVVLALMDQTMPAGPHSFTWRASNDQGPAPASGLYFLEFRAEGLTRSQRVVLIR